MNENLFFNVPVDFLLAHEDLLRQYPVNAEVFVDGDQLEKVTPELIRHVRSLFEGGGLRRRVHGPISEMVLGASDPRIRQVTIERYSQAIDFAEGIGAVSVTVHSGYDTLNKRNLESQYVQNMVPALRALAERAARKKLGLVLENTFEPSPDLLLDVFSALHADNVGMCFDVAHRNVFGKAPLEEWLSRCAPFIREVHITDNNGDWDDHLAPGRGGIDFKRFFNLIRENGIRPVFTFEPHDVDQFVETLGFVKSHPEYFMA